LKKYGLIGFPLTHSFSAPYFKQKFEDEQIDASYQNYSIRHIDELPELIKTEKLDGFNVTIPYKEKVIDYLDEISLKAQEVGAVNCVRVINGKLIGFNTDIIGFENSLLNFIPNPVKALVFGTGGASKAICYVLQKNNFEFQLVSRNETLNSITYSELTQDILESHHLIVNTTPVGTFPDIDHCIHIPYKWINQHHYIYDLIYNPAKTKFLSFCEAEGAHIKNGLEMLQIQAEESFKIFTNENVSLIQ
jgi:shikimate dehydrogenase